MTFNHADFYPVLDKIAAPIIGIDRQGKIILINLTASAIVGKTREQLIGSSVTSSFPFSDLKKSFSLSELPSSLDLTVRGQSYQGRWSTLEHHGVLDGILIFLHDITEDRETVQELNHLQEMSRELNAIFDYSFDGIYVTDGTGMTLRINHAYKRLTGLTEEDVIGKTMADLVKSGVFNESVTLKVLEKKEAVTIVQQVKKNNRTIVVTGNPVFNDQGHIVRVVTNVRDVTELHRLQERLKKMERLHSKYKNELQQLRSLADDRKQYVIISKKMKEIYRLATKLSQVDSTVLIQGESGVGKEVVSEIMHSHGYRNGKPFIKISCAAIPENLLESELFGYASGAFTGADRHGRTGLFERAHGGTIFLDEIGELPMSLQVKLLRVLQQREVVRIGSHKPVKVDTRIVAATNQNLEKMVREKRFRKDLFFRLNVVPLLVPPLRERKEAISHFIYFFLNKCNYKNGTSKQIAPEAVDVLIDYDWPGNVRELENMVERLVILAQGEVITAADLPGKVRTSPVIACPGQLDGKTLKEALEEVEKQFLLQAVIEHKTTRKIADALGINQSTVVRKAKRLNISLTAKA